MAAIDDLTNAVNTAATGINTSLGNLTASVDEAVKELGTLTPTDTQLAAATSVITQQVSLTQYALTVLGLWITSRAFLTISVQKQKLTCTKVSANVIQNETPK